MRELAAALVAAGAEGVIGGCTEAPLLLEADDVAVPLTDPWARRTLNLVVRPGPLSPAASLLLDHLHAAS